MRGTVGVDGSRPGRGPCNAQIVASAPEVLVVAYSRGSAGVTLEALQVLAGLSEWWALPAARAGAVYMADEETVAVPGPQ